MVPAGLIVNKYPYSVNSYISKSILPARQTELLKHGEKKSLKNIFQMDTRDISQNKLKTYALQESVRDPKRLHEFLELIHLVA